MIGSDNYPYICFENIVEAVEYINDNFPHLFKREKHKLGRQHCDLSVVQATRKNPVNGSNCPIGRCEVTEIILRLCFSWKIEVYGYGQELSSYLVEFFKIYIDPFFEASNILKQR